MNLTGLLTLLTYIATSLALSRWLPTQQLLFEMSLNHGDISKTSRTLKVVNTYYLNMSNTY